MSTVPRIRMTAGDDRDSGGIRSNNPFWSTDEPADPRSRGSRQRPATGTVRAGNSDPRPVRAGSRARCATTKPGSGLRRDPALLYDCPDADDRAAKNQHADQPSVSLDHCPPYGQEHHEPDDRGCSWPAQAPPQPPGHEAKADREENREQTEHQMTSDTQACAIGRHKEEEHCQTRASESLQPDRRCSDEARQPSLVWGVWHGDDRRRRAHSSSDYLPPTGQKTHRLLTYVTNLSRCTPQIVGITSQTVVGSVRIGTLGPARSF